MSYVIVFSMLNELRWEAIVRFVDIGGIINYHCLNFLFIIVLMFDHNFKHKKHKNLQCSLVKPPPSVQSVVWRYNEFGDILRDIENRKLGMWSYVWKDKLSQIVSTQLTCILNLYKYISTDNICLINKYIRIIIFTSETSCAVCRSLSMLTNSWTVICSSGHQGHYKHVTATVHLQLWGYWKIPLNWQIIDNLLLC